MSQEPALFPRRTVLENIAYAPLLQGRSDAAARDEVAGLLELLRLDGFEERRPDQLSGGERQRVALARTLAARPRVVLLDEPFASIDVEGRAELRAEFRRVLHELGTAAIHVTHDREEGLFLGDRVGILLDGRLESLDRPEAVYANPRSERSARLLGYGVLTSPGGHVAVRPDELRIVPAGAGRADATVLVVGTTGPEGLTVLGLDDGGRVEVRGPRPAHGPEPGARVGLDWSRAVPLPEGRPAPDAPGPPKDPKRRDRLRSS